MYNWRLKGQDSLGKSFEITPNMMINNDLSIWSGCESINSEFKVTIEEDENHWQRLSYDNLPKGFKITEVIFPAFETKLTEKTKLLLPESQGMLIENLATHDTFIFNPDDGDYIYETRFRAMKFATIFEEGGNTFFAINDMNCYSKSGDIYRSKDRTKLYFDFINSVPEDGASGYTMPYAIKAIPFEGDWFEAARLYKNIFPSTAKGIVREHDRMRDIGMWLWNRDNSSWVIPPAEQLQIDSGVPVGLDWYWYHAHPYDTHYPDFWPPREGVEKFTQELTKLREKNIFTQVYVNGFLWDMENDNWHEGGSAGVIKDKESKAVSTAFNVFFNREMAYMCGEAYQHHDKLISEIEKLADCGLEGIYIDMIGCATMQYCYNSEHNHAAGGGAYMAAGYRDMLKKLHEKRPELYISTEDCNETYMEYVDSVISVMATTGERYGVLPPFSYVPFFAAVHHGNLTVYGSSAHIDGVPPFDTMWPQESRWSEEPDWNSIAPEQFYVELGRSLIWGQQPMVANLRPEHLTDPKLVEQYNFICDTAKTYYHNRNWLLDGEMLHPGVMKCANINVKFVSRYIFTKAGEYKVVEREMPVIMHSVWVDKSGQAVLVALNISATEQSFEFVSEDKITIKSSLPAHSYEVFTLKKC